MIGATLFECQPIPRQFLFFKWMAGTHDWRELDRWKTPLHYGTAFHTHIQCTKCWEERIETVEAYGPVSSGEIILFAKRLREYGKAIEGDGFGKIGDLKAAVKRTCVRLEEVAELIDACEAQVVAAPKEPHVSNPDCLGSGSDNTPGCTCRRVFDSINRKNHSSTI